MSNVFLNRQFVLVAAANHFLFLIVATWSLLPLYIVEIGGSKTDVGLVMGSMGITSLGCLPLIAPLIDRYGRKLFIILGSLIAGPSNLGYLWFDSYSHLMIAVRLVQGLAFAACFNACSAAVVDLVPQEKRAQGIGLFGVSGSLAMAIGPYLGETAILSVGFQAYFILLATFGLMGLFTGFALKEPTRTERHREAQGFFTTAISGGYMSMMVLAAIFGSGFAAMNTYFPLMAQELGLRAGMFFMVYGMTLILVRVLLGQLADQIERGRLILACLVGFGIMLALTSRINSQLDTALLGGFFGMLQGLSYPAMMARMVDRSDENNRAIVVSFFTGSFGLGINLSAFVWGFIADLRGLAAMYFVAGLVMLLSAAFWVKLAAGKCTR
jgi:MFS family permease